MEHKKEGTYLEHEDSSVAAQRDLESCQPDYCVYNRATARKTTAKSAKAKAKQEAAAFKDRYQHDYGL